MRSDEISTSKRPVNLNMARFIQGKSDSVPVADLLSHLRELALDEKPRAAIVIFQNDDGTLTDHHSGHFTYGEMVGVLEWTKATVLLRAARDE